MAESLLTCPLCGFEFAPADTACHHGCPLKTACNLTRCPLCEYEFPATPRSVSWLQGLFRRRRAAKRAAAARRRAARAPSRGPRPKHHPGTTCPEHDDEMLTVKDLAGGDRAEVLHLEADDPDRSNSLAVFGLVPGSEITLVQRRPSFVLQVGETMLALDAEVAGSIVVRRPAAEGC